MVLQACVAGAIVLLFTAIFVWAVRCRHTWEVVTDRELKSRFREVKEVSNATFVPDAEYYAKIVYVAVVKCADCGRLKVFRETN